MSLEQSYTSNLGILISGFILTLGLLLAVCVIGQNRVNDISEDFEDFIQNDVAQFTYLAQMRSANRERMVTLWKISVMDDAFDRNDTYEEFLYAGTDFLIAREKLLKTRLSPTEQNLYKKLSKSTAIAAEYHRALVIQMQEDEDYISNTKVLHEIIPSNRNSLDVLNELIYLQNSESINAFDKTAQDVKNTTLIMTLLTLLTVVIGSVFAIYTIHANKNLINKIHKTNRELEVNNQTLESRVEQRTLQLQTANDKLKEIAHYDILTGLANRSLLTEQLRLVITTAKRDQKKAAILFIDLDGFKPVNDTYGHHTGDLVLKEVANRLQNLTRESDLASRLGGDEFIIVLSTIQEDAHAVMFAQKLIATLNEPFQVKGNVIKLSASVGISYYPGDADTADDLLSYADIAMYDAKHYGKNQYKIYNPVENTAQNK